MTCINAGHRLAVFADLTLPLTEVYRRRRLLNRGRHHIERTEHIMATTHGNNPAAGTTHENVPQNTVDNAPKGKVVTLTQAESDALDARLRSDLGATNRSVENTAVTFAIISEKESWRLQVSSKTGKPFQSLASYITDRQADFPGLGKVLGKTVIAELFKQGATIRAALAAVGGTDEMSVGTAQKIQKAIREAEATAAEEKAMAELQATDPKAAAKAKADAKAKEAKAVADAKAKATARLVEHTCDVFADAAEVADGFSTDQLAEVLVAAKAAVAALEAEGKRRLEAHAKAEAEAKAKAEAERTSGGRTRKGKTAPAAPAAPLAGAPADPAALAV